MNKIAPVVIGIIFFVIGGVCGFVFNALVGTPQLQKLQSAVASPSLLMSVNGTIAAINGKTITLHTTLQGVPAEDLMVTLGDKATIKAFVSTPSADGKTNTLSQNTVNLSDVKVGATATISVKILPDGSLE